MWVKRAPYGAEVWPVWYKSVCVQWFQQRCVCVCVFQCPVLCVCVSPEGKALKLRAPESKQLWAEPGAGFLNDRRPEMESTWGVQLWNIHVTQPERVRAARRGLRSEGAPVVGPNQKNIFKTRKSFYGRQQLCSQPAISARWGLSGSGWVHSQAITTPLTCQPNSIYMEMWRVTAGCDGGMRTSWQARLERSSSGVRWKFYIVLFPHEGRTGNERVQDGRKEL